MNARGWKECETKQGFDWGEVGWQSFHRLLKTWLKELCQHLSLPACFPACTPICLSVWLSVYVCVSLSICLSVCLSVSYCLSMSVSHCASACLSVRHSHIIEWPAVLTCFLSLNLAPSRCIMYLLSTWHPACRTCTSREDNEATVKLKQPCSTNFRQSTWKSSKQKKINTIAVKLNFMLQFSDCQKQSPARENYTFPECQLSLV